MARAVLEGCGKEPPVAFKRRRLRRALTALGLALTVLTVAGAGVTTLITRPAVAAAVSKALRDPASILAQRSPGARGLALFLTKHRPPASPSREYGEAPPPNPGPDSVYTETGKDIPQLAFGGPPGVGEGPGLDLPPPPPVFALEVGSPTPGPGEGGGGPLVVGGPPFGGGPIGDTTGPISVNPLVLTPTTTDAVPEPSLWAMLILGFFGAGAALRARRDRAVSDDARA